MATGTSDTIMRIKNLQRLVAAQSHQIDSLQATIRGSNSELVSAYTHHVTTLSSKMASLKQKVSTLHSLAGAEEYKVATGPVVSTLQHLAELARVQDAVCRALTQLVRTASNDLSRLCGINEEIIAGHATAQNPNTLAALTELASAALNRYVQAEQVRLQYARDRVALMTAAAAAAKRVHTSTLVGLLSVAADAVHTTKQ